MTRYAALVAAGFPEQIGALLDTSRIGWGGPARPTAAGTSTDINAFVEQSRVDRRPTRLTWCNQKGTGLGELPRATPQAHVHAYAWVKQPGVSDGNESRRRALRPEWGDPADPELQPADQRDGRSAAARRMVPGRLHRVVAW